MEEYFVPGHLLEKIDRQHLAQFMKNEGLDISENKSKMLYDLIDTINNLVGEDVVVEREELIASYYKFLLATLKHNNNRTIITYPIYVTEHSSYYSVGKLSSHFKVDNVELLNHSTVIAGENISKGDFVEIYRYVTEIDGLVKSIELCYGRIYDHTRSDGNTIEKYEYVWCEIDSESEILRIILPAKGKNEASQYSLQKTFFDRLKKDYGIVTKDLNESITLFKIYKNLTQQLELPYSQEVSPYQEAIDDFVTQMKQNIGVTDVEDIGLSLRIRKLFERNLIKKDFQNFRTKKVDDGRVISINFSDAFGGKVKASAGGSFINGETVQDLDLQDSDVYFDTKESIYRMEKLPSVTVKWINNSDFVDDRFDYIEVRYTACQGFYITHFLRYNVREELFNYVLPKFDEFKRRPL